MDLANLHRVAAIVIAIAGCVDGHARGRSAAVLHVDGDRGEPGKMAHWIAPPKHGIKGRPIEFEYVRRHGV